MRIVIGNLASLWSILVEFEGADFILRSESSKLQLALAADGGFRRAMRLVRRIDQPVVPRFSGFQP
jgi:hypothetical protein